MAPPNPPATYASRHGVRFSHLFVIAWMASSVSMAKADVITTKKKLDLSSIESNVGDKLIAQHVPGAALVIVKDGKVIDIKCYGYRDFSQLLPVTPLTPFCIGTCTKAFTTMAAEMAVDAGVISLSDNPNKYLPEFRLKDPNFSERVTLRDFLSQRADLDEKSLDIDWNDTTPKKMLHVISGERPSRKPNRTEKNDNMNICVAGWAVAAAAGTTFDKLIADSIFRPLAMNDSRLASQIRLAEDARGHILDKHAQPTRFEREMDEVFLPASGIISSARDMAKWLDLLTSEGVFDGKRLISERGFRELLNPQLDSKSSFAESVGLSDDKIGGYRVIKHSGGQTGYCASVMFLPDRHIGVVLLTNLGPSSQEVEQNLPAWIIAQVVASGD